MILRHPSKSALQAWLTAEPAAGAVTGAGVAAIDRHLDVCPRCAAALEALEPAQETRIGEALKVVLAPPDDLAQRLERGVTAKLSSRQMMEVVADLFGAGFEATRLMLIEDQDDDS